MTRKIAVVLLNLGGPDKLSSVKGFLFNLFYDKAIIRISNPFRWILAKFISSKREKIAQEIYQQIGGSSTILPITIKQAEKLELALKTNKKDEFKVFVSMRYWHPFAREVIKEIEKYKADEILLVPLYPQFSTTTTESSFEEFKKISKQKVKTICCYYKNHNFIKAHVDLIKEAIKKVNGEYRVLFSAHGLPEIIIKKGDPYQWQVEETVKEIIKNLDETVDFAICYQSKVGSLKWISPSTEDELLRATQDDKSVIIVPIAFVSDHSETLVELDIEYKELFEIKSNKQYIRVNALNENEDFISCLVDQVHLMLENETQTRKCPKEFCGCYKEK